MADGVEVFKEQFPSLESYWRSIILFGANVASYKFALAKSLLEIAPTGKTSITLRELAEPYSRYLREHIAKVPKQATSQSSRFIQACKDYDEGKISYDKMINTTVSLGFNNVIDAFHVVGKKEIPISFYQKDYQGRDRRIILTDDVFRLLETPNPENFESETESRWNLVETAWELGVSRNLLNVKYDEMSQMFFVDPSFRRKDVTSARSALNGYQKGKCFYCFDDITVSNDKDNTCDVDHFFPHTLQPHMPPDVNLDGVWNLVLACSDCNRGLEGKWAYVPATRYLERLHKRNEFLISSHHPLRETIMRQTGATEQERAAFLRRVDQIAIGLLLHRWETLEKAPATF